MHKELPLYIFIRNTVILCLIFFVASFVIIERGKIERGDHSIFQGIIKNKENIRDYNSPDFSSIDKKDQDFQYSNNQYYDTTGFIQVFGTKVVEYKNKTAQNNKEVDL